MRSNLKAQAAIGLNPFKTGSLKGQAAMEYLMTYGWAILVLMIVVGYVLGSGVLDPGPALSEGCSLETTSFNCRTFVSKQADDVVVDLVLTNSLGYPIGVHAINVLAQDGTVLSTYTPEEDRHRLSSGATLETSLRLLDQRASTNDFKNYNLEVLYFSCAPELNIECTEPPEDDLSSVHTVTGRISARIAETEEG